MRNLVIFGDSLFAERLYRYIEHEKNDTVVAFTQEQRFMSRDSICGIPVVPFESLANDIDSDFEIIIGIGYSDLNNLRVRIYNMCKDAGHAVGTYISRNATVYTENIAEGSFICPGAILGPGVKVGICNFIASGSILSHDNILGNFNFISSGATFGGYAEIKDYCFIGLNSTIKDNISIADKTLIGAATNVLKSITQTGQTFIGNPARLLNNSHES